MVPRVYLHFPHSVLCPGVGTLEIVRVQKRLTSRTSSEHVLFAQHEPTSGARLPLGIRVEGTQDIVPTSDARHADEVVARHVDDSLHSSLVHVAHLHGTHNVPTSRAPKKLRSCHAFPCWSVARVLIARTTRRMECGSANAVERIGRRRCVCTRWCASRVASPNLVESISVNRAPTAFLTDEC